VADYPDSLEPKLRGLALKDAAYRLRYEQERGWLSPGGAIVLLAKVFDTLAPAELVAAHEAAAKLEQDYSTYFRYRDDGNYSEALRTASEKVRELNPGFSEETYDLAMNSLAIAMR
jgi:hypothetical protein